jgi:hypothetical protein
MVYVPLQLEDGVEGLPGRKRGQVGLHPGFFFSVGELHGAVHHLTRHASHRVNAE